MSTISVCVPLQHYLNTVYRPDRDYVDGRLEKRHVGEFDHSKLQVAIARYIAERGEQFRVAIYPEIRVQVAPERFRVADLCCVRCKPVSGIVTEAPVLVIEILSPRDTVPQTEDRIEDYLAMGVPFVWLIDPRNLDRAWIYEPGQPRRQVRDRVLTAGDIRVPLDELPEQRDFE
jgi:Uma2 family endonuclease